MKFRFSRINIPLIVRNLRSVCNWMIAFEAFCTAFNLLSYLFLTPVLSGLWPKMPTLDCFIFQAPFGFAYEMMAMMPFAIGAERFVVAFFPLWFAFFILFDSIFKKADIFSWNLLGTIAKRGEFLSRQSFSFVLFEEFSSNFWSPKMFLTRHLCKIIFCINLSLFYNIK